MTVKLRKRKGKKSTSLFLDIQHKGKRSYEFLNLHLRPQDKDNNKEVLRLAQKIRTKRELDLSYSQHGEIAPSELGRNFYRFAENFISTKYGSNHDGYHHALRHLENFSPALVFKEIDEVFCEAFRDYLLKKVSQNSARIYFSKFVTILNKAVKSRTITYNPAIPVESIKKKESPKAYLTSGEYKTLASTPCRYPEVKRMFLFACLTGLRKIDLENLEWSDIKKDVDGYSIVFDQSKGGGINYLPLSSEAVELFRDHKQEGQVFKKVAALWWVLREWVKEAGIKKNISFHSSRHTFAVFALRKSGNLKLVQSLLGHKSIKTTEVYAKIVDKEKRQAVEGIF